MGVLYLTEDDVRELLDMQAAIEIVHEAFTALANGEAHNQPRVRASGSGIMLHTMSAAADYLDVVGWKAYSTTRSSAKFHVALYDKASGEMIALIEADYLGQVRTGAASGVATEFMARPDSVVVGLFGTGKQARTQLEAACVVRKIDRVEVYSRNSERRQAFIDEMSPKLEIEIVEGLSPDDTAAEKDIVICATGSKVPVFDGRVLEEGTHLNVIGSNFLTKAEIDEATVRMADIIVCDSIEQCRLEAGDFAAALDSGVTDWRLMSELAEIVTDRKTGRAHPEDVTLFKSVGLAIEDVAVGHYVLSRAREEGRGRELAIG